MSKWSDWKKNMGDARPWHLLDPERLLQDQSIAEQRMEICRSCPELIQATNQCSKCGCFMLLKTKLANAECPLGKWSRED